MEGNSGSTGRPIGTFDDAALDDAVNKLNEAVRADDLRKNLTATADPETIEEEARRIVGGDRRESYGPVRDSFESIASIWTGIIGCVVTAENVALCMIGLKIARESNAHKRDNLVDLLGYTFLLEALQDAPAEEVGINRGY